MLPTAVNAGLGTPTGTEPRLGQGLVLAGAGMLLIAGSLQLRGRRGVRAEA